MFRTAIFLCAVITAKGQYEIPGAHIQIFRPRGLKVSIPDGHGIKKITFFASINKELAENANDLIRKDIENPSSGFWMFEDHDIPFSSGDVLFYQIKVDFFDGKEITSLDKGVQKFTIGATTTSKVPTVTPTPVCEYTPTIVSGKRSCKGTLLFQDVFNTLSPQLWQTEIRFAGEPDYEFVVYQDNDENLRINDNMLQFTPTLVDKRKGAEFASNAEILDLGENCTGIPGSSECVQKPRAWSILPPTYSAQITTKDRFSFVYGVVEVRAKLPKGDWIYPQLYLRSKNDFYGAGYDSGLIKIAFVYGNVDMNNVLSGGCVFGESVYARYYGIKSIDTSKDWTNDFHVYKLEWRPDGISLIVDNEVYGNVYPPDGGFVLKDDELNVDRATAERWRKGTEMAPFDKEMYIIFGVGVGGVVFPNRKDGKKPWSNEDPKAQLNFYKALDTWYQTWSNSSSLIIDYVRVWAL